MSVNKRKRGNKAETRERILDAAFRLIAENGATNLALTEVVKLSGVHRATLYQHFATRDELLRATADRFSTRFYDTVLGKTGMQVEPRPEGAEIIELNTRFATFVMENPELCRIWLFELLGSPNPADDPVWQEYQEAHRKFFRMEVAQEKIDSEVMTVLMLAGGVLWPVLSRAHGKSAVERKEMAQRFTNTVLRLAMWGSLKPEFFPEIAAFLKSDGET
jgi:AcrR family transcriptional regulator